MSVLWWPGKLLAEDDLRRHWTSQGEIVLGPRTIVTPLAWDFLRGKRIAVRREDRASDTGVSLWGVGIATPTPIVVAAVKSVEGLTPLRMDGDVVAAARSIAGRVANGNPPGAIVIGDDAGLVACVANKTVGVRAASVSGAKEIAALQKTLGPNVLAVAVSGRTFHELRQMLKTASAIRPECPNGLNLE